MLDSSSEWDYYCFIEVPWIVTIVDLYVYAYNQSLFKIKSNFGF